MMDKIREYKKQIVLAGFGIGILGFFNILPNELPVIEGFTKLLYAGVVALGAYSFWTFYANMQPVRRAPAPGRRMPPKKRKKPDYQKYPKTKDEVDRSTPSDRIFEEFYKD